MAKSWTPTMAAMVLVAGIAVSAACVGSDPAAREAAERDYKRLSGTWQLTRAIVDGQPVPEAQIKATGLITDGNTFRFPQASGVGTHPAGTFTINPSTLPRQVDSVAVGGPNAGQVTLGIFEIIDDTHKRACWGPPGGPRPTGFEAPPGSRRILQYWEKIGPVPRANKVQLMANPFEMKKVMAGRVTRPAQARITGASGQDLDVRRSRPRS